MIAAKRLGVHSVLECVGLEQSTETAIGIARPGGAVGRVGVPQEDQAVTAAGWTGEELQRIGSAEELQIAPARADGTLGQPVAIWVVRVGDELYVRSWRGTGGGWFRAARASRAARISAGGVEKDVELLDAEERANDAVDGAYRHKYGRFPAYVEPMVSPQARGTTLRLVARGAEVEAG